MKAREHPGLPSSEEEPCMKHPEGHGKKRTLEEERRRKERPATNFHSINRNRNRNRNRKFPNRKFED